MKTPATDRGAITLWFAFTLPVLFSLLLLLGVSSSVFRDMERSTQNAGDLVARAAVLETIPYSEPVAIDSQGAHFTAMDYLLENLTPMAAFYLDDLETLITNPDLRLDDLTNRPISTTQQGIAVKVLTVGLDIDPTTGELAASPAVLVVIQMDVDCVFEQRQITTYSVARLPITNP